MAQFRTNVLNRCKTKTNYEFISVKIIDAFLHFRSSWRRPTPYWPSSDRSRHLRILPRHLRQPTRWRHLTSPSSRTIKWKRTYRHRTQHAGRPTNPNKEKGTARYRPSINHHENRIVIAPKCIHGTWDDTLKELWGFFLHPSINAMTRLVNWCTDTKCTLVKKKLTRYGCEVMV